MFAQVDWPGKMQIGKPFFIGKPNYPAFPSAAKSLYFHALATFSIDFEARSADNNSLDFQEQKSVF
jgi:hypothetical protein